MFKNQRCGGRVIPLSFFDELHELCARYDIKLHLDGSRIVNAMLVTKKSLAEMTKHCDSINFCFSKVKYFTEKKKILKKLIF